MKKKFGLLIVSAFVLSVIFSIASQASFVQSSISQYAVDDTNPSPTPFFFDPNADTGKVLLTVNCGEGGTVDPVGKHIIQRSTDVTLVFKPNEGYEIDKVTLAHGDQPATEVELTSYEYIEYAVDNSITFDVSFKKTGNGVTGLKDHYTIDETIDATAKGTGMDVTDGLKNGDVRWKPIGYMLNNDNNIVMFDSAFKVSKSASALGEGKHSLRVVFARQIYDTNDGWFYQRPVQDTNSLSLASVKKSKIKLSAVDEEALRDPFSEDLYVIDAPRFYFNVGTVATAAPTVAPTVVPTVAPTDAPTIEPTEEPVVITPTPKPEDPKPTKKVKMPESNGNQAPSTGDNTAIIPWLFLTLVAGLGVIIFSRKALCKK